MTLDPGQLSTVLRQGGQFSAGIATTFIALATLDPETSHKILDSLQMVHAGLSQATAGLSNLMIIIVPIAAGIMAKFAFNSSSLKSKVADVKAVAADPTQPVSTEAKDALQEAVASRPDRMVVAIDPASPAQAAVRVASLPEVKAVITNPQIAASTPAVPKIVSPAEAAAKL